MLARRWPNTRAVAAPSAYLAAGVFDLAWIVSMAVEWLARHDRRKAKLPRIAGHVALLISMAAVSIHGRLAGSWPVGLVGAVVSLLAKAMWTVVMRHNAKELDERSCLGVEQRMSEAGARLAMIAGREAVEPRGRDGRRPAAAPADHPVRVAESGRPVGRSNPEVAPPPSAKRAPTAPRPARRVPQRQHRRHRQHPLFPQLWKPQADCPSVFSDPPQVSFEAGATRLTWSCPAKMMGFGKFMRVPVISRKSVPKAMSRAVVASAATALALGVAAPQAMAHRISGNVEYSGSAIIQGYKLSAGVGVGASASLSASWGYDHEITAGKYGNMQFGNWGFRPPGRSGMNTPTAMTWCWGVGAL